MILICGIVPSLQVQLFLQFWQLVGGASSLWFSFLFSIHVLFYHNALFLFVLDQQRFGGKGKISHLQKLIAKHKADMVFIFQTKCWLSAISFSSVRTIQGMTDLEGVGVNAVGSSGGILCIWNKEFMSVSCKHTFQSWILLSCFFIQSCFFFFLSLV